MSADLDALVAPTPCAGTTVADLLDHVGGLCLAFTGAPLLDRLIGLTGRDPARRPDGQD